MIPFSRTLPIPIRSTFCLLHLLKRLIEPLHHQLDNNNNNGLNINTMTKGLLLFEANFSINLTLTP
ncbi:hypothetical protein BpHYR1_014345 [Brachionus plicatilis]|uniref:Uncharacterized protein n=1 Tax=Brachionus plicatilis TaxID=10195 RepID=A0A3M7Q815_BRAPC|nr:hypothetical protein BpHYR1_014345 [Brachionus plicatilis]